PPRPSHPFPTRRSSDLWAPRGAGAVALALAVAAACGKLGPDFNQLVAIEVAAPDSVEELDTLRPQARALDGRGHAVSADIEGARDRKSTRLNSSHGSSS